MPTPADDDDDNIAGALEAVPAGVRNFLQPKCIGCALVRRLHIKQSAFLRRATTIRSTGRRCLRRNPRGCAPTPRGRAQAFCCSRRCASVSVSDCTRRTRPTPRTARGRLRATRSLASRRPSHALYCGLRAACSTGSTRTRRSSRTRFPSAPRPPPAPIRLRAASFALCIADQLHQRRLPQFSGKEHDARCRALALRRLLVAAPASTSGSAPCSAADTFAELHLTRLALDRLVQRVLERRRRRRGRRAPRRASTTRRTRWRRRAARGASPPGARTLTKAGHPRAQRHEVGAEQLVLERRAERAVVGLERALDRPRMAAAAARRRPRTWRPRATSCARP